ncbi:hypothetical protein P3S67_013250 [Capsicum chacoense]
MSNLIELEELYLQSNNFSGPLPTEIFNISVLRVISLTNNNLSGSLPPLTCSILPKIEELYLVFTNLVGTIPHSIFNCSKLTRLELSHNQLTVLIPNSIGYLTHLQYLNLAVNNLTSDSSLSFLTSLINCRNLTTLSLTSNPLNGMLLASTGNLSTSLRNVYTNVCKIKKEKPAGLVLDSLHCLDVIDLTQHQLSGSLPNYLGKVTSLREIHMGSNILSSNILPSLGNLNDLVVLDLLSNNMVGSLPQEIGNLMAATLIDLSMNQFSNGIPREIGGLKNLAHFSLRRNKLHGSIPDSMSNMVGLEFLDLSYNNISGTIPMSPEKLQYLSISMFLSTNCMIILFLLLGLAILFVPIVFVFLWIKYRRDKRTPQQVDSLSTITRERISYYELLQATDDLSESNLIGSGSFRCVYQGILRCGTAIAVKVLNLQLDAAFKSFDTECEVLRSFLHRNLVKVITSCSNLYFKAVDYMPNGSLDKYLYSHNYILDIKQRLSIIIDEACALEYLHHGCSLPVIHCDVKPSNVLLDEDMVAHLRDFGISKLLGED